MKPMILLAGLFALLSATLLLRGHPTYGLTALIVVVAIGAGIVFGRGAARTWLTAALWVVGALSAIVVLVLWKP
jgi:hypothetical protein